MKYKLTKEIKVEVIGHLPLLGYPVDVAANQVNKRRIIEAVTHALENGLKDYTESVENSNSIPISIQIRDIFNKAE
jgi:hypothetical protein